MLLPSNINKLIAEVKATGPREWMPGKRHFTKNGDIDLCYETIGEAKKGNVLILNGHSQTLLGYPNHFHQPFLDEGYRVIRMDNRGVGESAWMQDWRKENAYTFNEMAADIVAVLNDLKIEKAHIIGISLGGMIAQTLAINHSERVQSLTSIMSTGFFYDPKLVNVPRAFLLRYSVIKVLYGRNLSTTEKLLRMRAATFLLLPGKGGYKMDIRSVIDKGLYEIVRRKGYNQAAFQQHAYAVRKSGSRYEGLKQLDVPTLIIHGVDDPLIKIEHSKKYAPMIRASKTLFLEGMGHDLPLEYMPQMGDAMLELMDST